MPSFNKKSTGDEVAKEWGIRIKGKTVLITGANVGLGYATARVLGTCGAEVVFTCRSAEKIKDTLEKLQNAVPGAKFAGLEMEMGSLKSVQKAVEEFKKKWKVLHVLINNAGVMACPKTMTEDGLESQFGVNHVAHYCLTMGLWDVLKKSGTKEVPARVLNLSSIAHWLFGPSTGILFDDLEANKSYSPWERYGQSKLANVLFSLSLHERAQKEKVPIISVSLHPGQIMATDLNKYMSFSTTMEILGKLLFSPKKAWEVMAEGPKSIPQGVSTTIYCALCPDIQSGEYYSHCAVENKVAHPLNKDGALAERLSQKTEEIIKVALGKN